MVDFTQYGWQGLIIAAIVCLSVGVLKTGIKTKLILKTSEQFFGGFILAITCLLAIGGAAVWWAVWAEFEFISYDFMTLVIWVIAASQCIYALYEKWGGRAMWKAFTKVFDRDKDGDIDLEDLKQIIQSFIKLNGKDFAKEISETISETIIELNNKEEL